MVIRIMLNPKSVDMEGVTTLAQAQAANEQLKRGIEERNKQAIAAWEARTGLKYDPEWREHVVRPDGPFREVDGSSIREGTIRNGEWDGEVREYNGDRLTRSVVYKNGVQTGASKEYRFDGTLAVERVPGEDGQSVTEIHYDASGKTENYRLVRGKRGVVLFDSRKQQEQKQEAPAETVAQPATAAKESWEDKSMEAIVQDIRAIRATLRADHTSPLLEPGTVRQKDGTDRTVVYTGGNDGRWTEVRYTRNGEPVGESLEFQRLHNDKTASRLDDFLTLTGTTRYDDNGNPVESLGYDPDGRIHRRERFRSWLGEDGDWHVESVDAFVVDEDGIFVYRKGRPTELLPLDALNETRGQAGNTALSAAMSGKGRVSERFSLNGDVVSAIDAVAPVAIVGELPDDVLKAFNVWKKTKKDADRRVLAEAILDHVGRQEIVNADTGKRIPFTSEGFASVLKHASTDGAVYGKARFLVGLAAFLKDAVEIYHEPAEVPTFHTFVAPIVDDKTGKRVYGIATISGTTRLKVYDLNVYTPGGKESVGSGGQKNVAHMTGAKDLNSAVPNTKILLKTIFENQSSPTITVPELMSHVPGNTALSVGDRAQAEEIRRAFTRPDGTKRYGWRKAPNGQASSLDEKQWLEAQTPRFKAQYGDWEAAALYNMAKRAWNDPKVNEKFFFKPSERLAKAIEAEVGHPIEQLVVKSDRVRHIKNHHSNRRVEAARGQRALSPLDVATIPYLVNNFDTIERHPKHDQKGRVAFRITKRINGISSIGLLEWGNAGAVTVTMWEVAPGGQMSVADGSPLIRNVQDEPGADVNTVQQALAKIKQDVLKLQSAVDANGEPDFKTLRAMASAAHGWTELTSSSDPKLAYELNGTLGRDYTIHERTINANVKERVVAPTGYARRPLHTRNEQIHSYASNDWGNEIGMMGDVSALAGNNLYVYPGKHGTDKFGFLVFLPEKSDDGISLFFAHDDDLASTYAGHGKLTRRLGEVLRPIQVKGKDVHNDADFIAEVRRAAEAVGATVEVVHFAEGAEVVYRGGGTRGPAGEGGETHLIIGVPHKDGTREYMEIETPETMVRRNRENNERKEAHLLKRVEEYRKRATSPGADYDYTAFGPVKFAYQNAVRELDEWRKNPDLEPTSLDDVINSTVSRINQEYTWHMDGKKEGIYDVALRIDRCLVVDARASGWNNIKMSLPGERKRSWKTREIAKYALEHGYDGVEINNVYDLGPVRRRGVAKEPRTIRIVFRSEQVKSVDPYTFNDAGQLIPLGERFDPAIQDIRFSVGERMGGRAPVVEPGGDVREAGESTLAWLRRKFVHSQTPVFDAVRRVMGVGREPPDALNVEAAAKNVHGKIRARQELLQRAYLEPLKAILAQPGMDRKRFDDYALALHALERNRMIQERSVVVDPTSGEVVDLGVEAGSGVTNAWAERVIREIQRDPFAAQYKEASNILAEMNRFVLRGAVADGLLTEAQARTWMRLSPHYVPLKSGGAAPGAIHKRATGRFTRPDSVLVNSMRQAYATVRNGELNRVNKTMADWIREYDPNGEQLGGTVPESHKHAKIKMTEPQYVPKGSAAEALLRERGIRLVETEDKGGYWVDTGVLPQALKRIVRESVPQGDDIVTFWEGGERKFIRFEGKRGRDGEAENEAARIADALNFKNVLHKEGRFWDAIRGLTRWKANVSTSWNPTFIVRNMGADVFNTANLMMIEGKYAELARTMRNYPEALRTIARLHSLRREAGDSKMERMFADVSVQSSVGDCGSNLEVIATKDG